MATSKEMIIAALIAAKDLEDMGEALKKIAEVLAVSDDLLWIDDVDEVKAKVVELIRDEVKNADDLEDLCGALCASEHVVDAYSADSRSDIYLADLVDLADLPTFGSDTPEGTDGIFSWDNGSFLIPGCGAGDTWVIEPREGR